MQIIISINSLRNVTIWLKIKRATDNQSVSPLKVGMRRQHVLRLKFIIFVILLHKCLNYKRNRN